MSRRRSAPAGSSAPARRERGQAAVPRIRDEECDIAGLRPRTPPAGDRRTTGPGSPSRRTARAVRIDDFPERPRSARRPSCSPADRCASRRRTPDTGCDRPRRHLPGAARAVRRRNATVRPRTREDFAMRCSRSHGSRRPATVRSTRKDLGMHHRGLARGAAIEHLVAELVLVVAYPLGRGRLEHRVDLAAQLRDRARRRTLRATARTRRVRAAPIRRAPPRGRGGPGS